MYIKNKRNISNVKACSLFELSCKLKDLCFEIAYFSYTQRCMGHKTENFYLIAIRENKFDLCYLL